MMMMIATSIMGTIDNNNDNDDSLVDGKGNDDDCHFDDSERFVVIIKLMPIMKMVMSVTKTIVMIMIEIFAMVALVTVLNSCTYFHPLVYQFHFLNLLSRLHQVKARSVLDFEAVI